MGGYDKLKQISSQAAVGVALGATIAAGPVHAASGNTQSWNESVQTGVAVTQGPVAKLLGAGEYKYSVEKGEGNAQKTSIQNTTNGSSLETDFNGKGYTKAVLSNGFNSAVYHNNYGKVSTYGARMPDDQKKADDAWKKIEAATSQVSKEADYRANATAGHYSDMPKQSATTTRIQTAKFGGLAP